MIFKERGRKGEREGEKHQHVVASCMPPTGMFPDWELNLGPFGMQTSTQSTEPHQPGSDSDLKISRGQ